MKNLSYIKQYLCTWIALEIFNNNDQQFNITFYLEIRITTFNFFFHNKSNLQIIGKSFS